MIRVSDSFFGKKFRRLENWVIFAPLFQKAVYAPGWRNFYIFFSQNPVIAISCGFDSRPGYKPLSIIVKRLFFFIIFCKLMQFVDFP